MVDKADTKLIKTLNEIRLLNIIKEECPICRNDLAKKTKISKVAVSDIIGRLIQAGYVLEIGKGQSTRRGGKRPTMLKLNSENGYVIGMEIKRRHTVIALANIESEIRGLEKLEYEAGASIHEVLPKIFEKIDRLFADHDIDRKKLISMGIGIPGFVDYANGELIFADTLVGWDHLPISSQFYERYHVPVSLENDVNTITLGESLLGAGRNRSNLACIWLGEGIGAGIIMDDQMVRGETGNAGEIGYLELGYFVANVSRMKNLYANQRYFGEILSESNLSDVLRMKLQWTPQQLGMEVLEDVLTLGDQGNMHVQGILDEYAYPLSLLCLNFIKSINPSLIILSGRTIENSRYLIEKVRQLVKQGMMNIPFQPSSIVVGELKEKAGVLGAISLALRTLFEPPMSKSHNHLKAYGIRKK